MEISQEWINHNIWWVLLVALWELGWKGIALWKAAKKDSKAWFVTLLIINTAGLLPILYTFIFSKQESINGSEQ